MSNSVWSGAELNLCEEEMHKYFVLARRSRVYYTFFVVCSDVSLLLFP